MKIYKPVEILLSYCLRNKGRQSGANWITGTSAATSASSGTNYRKNHKHAKDCTRQVIDTILLCNVEHSALSKGETPSEKTLPQVAAAWCVSGCEVGHLSGTSVARLCHVDVLLESSSLRSPSRSWHEEKHLEIDLCFFFRFIEFYGKHYRTDTFRQQGVTDDQKTYLN